MSGTDNLLQTVQTYQKSALGALTNQNCFMDPRVANFKFENFDRIQANLGSTVNVQLPFRYVTHPSLTATAQPTTERLASLTINRPANTSTSWTAEELITNVDRFLPEISAGAATELGAEIEGDIGTVIPDSTYRFVGDGNTAISSFGQLAFFLAFQEVYGVAKTNRVGILDPISASTVVNSGLTQFVLDRNEKMANSWELGAFKGTEWFTSNLLPTHTAGYAGNTWANGATGTTLTFVSISADGTQITFSGAGSQSDFFLKNDLLEFTTDIRYVTYTGHKPSQSTVQVRVTADADSSGGNVTVNVYPALLRFDANNPNAEANLTRALTTSDQAVSFPSHRCGLIMGGKPMFIAMPKLPMTQPFTSSNDSDPNTGASIRMYSGYQFPNNVYMNVLDCVWGKMLVPEYAMRVLIPL